MTKAFKQIPETKVITLTLSVTQFLERVGQQNLILQKALENIIAAARMDSQFDGEQALQQMLPAIYQAFSENTNNVG